MTFAETGITFAGVGRLCEMPTDGRLPGQRVVIGTTLAEWLEDGTFSADDTAKTLAERWDAETREQFEEFGNYGRQP